MPKLMTLTTELILDCGVCEPKTFSYQRQEPENPKSPIMALIVCECGWYGVGSDWESVAAKFDHHLSQGGFAVSDLNED